MKAALASRAGPFAWKEWAAPMAFAILAGLGFFDFSSRLDKLDTKLGELVTHVDNDYRDLVGRIGALAIQQARDEAGRSNK